MPIDLQIVCPSCYRRNGSQTIIEAVRVSYPLPVSQKEGFIYVYECTDSECNYHTTQHAFLFHEYRVKYHKLLQLALNIRGWVQSSFNTDFGKLWVIYTAVEHYFEDK